ncbi:MAG: hypothetical protein ACLU4J_08690 [Butyricimonas paravirosa]
MQDIGDWYDKNVQGSMVIQGRMLREIRLGARREYRDLDHVVDDLELHVVTETRVVEYRHVEWHVELDFLHAPARGVCRRDFPFADETPGRR